MDHSSQKFWRDQGFWNVSELVLIICATLRPADGFHWETVPKNGLFDIENGTSPFPVTIKDGESISIPLGPFVTDYLRQNKLEANLKIFDSEGKSYSKYEAKIFDGKWGGYYYQ